MSRRQGLLDFDVDVGTNAALWVERFQPGGLDGKQAGAHLAGAARAIHVPTGYARAVSQREAMLRDHVGSTERGGTCLYTASAQGRIVAGLGSASIQETAIHWLRPWGVPMLRGSSLKGLAASAAHHRGGTWRAPQRPDDEPGDDFAFLFGSLKRAGCVTFHDAWWLTARSAGGLDLSLDVMTVHHPEYYRGSGAPTDFDEPNPVNFLTVHGDFLVALTGPRDWVQVAQALLTEALDLDGIGAKTAAGYGRMTLKPRLSGFEQAAATLGDTVVNVNASNARAFLDGLTELARDPLRVPGELERIAAAAEVAHDSVWKKRGLWDAERESDEGEQLLRAARQARLAQASQPKRAPTKAQAKAAEEPIVVEIWPDQEPKKRQKKSGKGRIPGRDGDFVIKGIAIYTKDKAIVAAFEQVTEQAPLRVRAVVNKNKLKAILDVVK